jgi:phosphotransferase system IIB component
MRVLSVVLSALIGAAWLASGSTQPAQDPKIDTARIEEITGLKGTFNEEEGVFKVTLPRTDLKISVDHESMSPFMGLTTWAAFQKGKGARAMVMGDLVLFQDEVNPVMSALLDAGLSVTALHNHFLFDEPRVYFMHIDGEDTVEALSIGVRKALDRVKEVRAASPSPSPGFGAGALPGKSSITPQPLEAILGVKGQTKDGMFKVVIGRTTHAACGCAVGKEMGVNTWAAFAGSDDDALVDGDFAVLETELQPVLKVLRKEGIAIVAIHSHMTGETPRVLFLHYWGRGKALALAKTVGAALQVQGK